MFYSIFPQSTCWLLLDSIGLDGIIHCPSFLSLADVQADDSDIVVLCKVNNHNCVQIYFYRFHLITAILWMTSALFLYIEMMGLSVEFAKLVWLCCSLLSKKIDIVIGICCCMDFVLFSSKKCPILFAPFFSLVYVG